MALAKVKRQRKLTETVEYKSDQEDQIGVDDKEIDEIPESNTENEDEELASNENDESGEDSEEGNAGWADSIAKVLSSTKPKTKKTVVLSRAKKLQRGKESIKNENPTYDFEVEGEIKEEPKPDLEDTKDNVKQRKNVQLPLRVRPTWKDIERERNLRKIATKGVVQLFNAVRMQQKDLEQKLEEAGPLDSRKDAVLHNINKKKFLDVLMSGSRAKSETVDNSVKTEKKEDQSSSESDEEDKDGTATNSGRKRKSQWSVLQPDFMTNKKNKHWDEEDDDSDENKNQSNEDSGDDDEE